MPVPYQVPPWLAMRAPPNPAESYIENLRVGAQIGQEQAQLAQRREIAQMELQARQQANAQEQRLQQQKIEYDHAMRQAELGLEQQKLEEAKQVNQIKIQAAARQYAAQQAIEADIAGGMRPEEAMLRHAAGMDFSAGDIGALVRGIRPQPTMEPEIKDVGGYKMMRESTNRWKLLPQPIPEGAVQLREVKDPTGKVNPNLYATIGPTGTPSVHPYRQERQQTVPDKIKMERALLLNRIRRLSKILDSESGTAFTTLASNRWQKELQKPKKERVAKNENEMKAIVRKELEDEIERLEKQVRATTEGGGVRYDSATGKLIREQTAVSQEPTTDDQDNEFLRELGYSEDDEKENV